jgi:hypothetical protein
MSSTMRVCASRLASGLHGEQPLAEGSLKQISSFTSSRIFDFNWSQDGKQLLLSREEISSDVVLLGNLR